MRSPTSRTARLARVAAATAALGLAAACGNSSAPPASSAAGLPEPAASAAAPSPAPAASGGHAMSDMPGMAGMGSGAAVELYAVQTGGLGVVVTDGDGRLVYGSDQDMTDPPMSMCTGTCAQEWEPLVVPEGQQPDLLGVDADEIGRVARDDGSSQVTLGGWPVYVNRHDDGGLKTAAPDAHGTWFVLTPQGKRVQV